MLEEIDHPYARGEEVYDVTFENVQAGLRTDYLFRIANQRGGIVLGTGDLSELALGWATYGVGDQMSHYNVNAGVPKTLIQHLIRWVVASGQFEDEVGETLTAILGTEISPELVPGEELQSTESKIGPYALHDFTLFHVLRFGFRPSKIGFLAWHAWARRRAGRMAAELPRGQAGRLRRGGDPQAGSRSSASASSGSPSSSARRCPNGPKVSARRLALAARRLARPLGQPRRRPGCATSSAGAWGTSPSPSTRRRARVAPRRRLRPRSPGPPARCRLARAASRAPSRRIPFRSRRRMRRSWRRRCR